MCEILKAWFTRSHTKEVKMSKEIEVLNKDGMVYFKYQGPIFEQEIGHEKVLNNSHIHEAIQDLRAKVIHKFDIAISAEKMKLREEYQRKREAN